MEIGFIQRPQQSRISHLQKNQSYFSKKKKKKFKIPICTKFHYESQAESKRAERTGQCHSQASVIFEKLWRLRELPDNWGMIDITPILKKSPGG